MKKIVSILKNRDIMKRILFVIMILLVVRIGASITVPGVTINEDLQNALNSGSAIGIMNLLGGGALSNFSIFALGVGPYITAQIITEILSKDVLPSLTELTKQGQYGRRKIEMATRYLCLLLGVVQGYGIIKTMENSQYISISFESGFLTYAYLVVVLLAGTMIMMWLGDQITTKGIGNGISVLIFAGCVRTLPTQISTAFQKWVINYTYSGSNQRLVEGVFRFAIYVLVLLAIIAFVTYIELSKRKIPVQHSGKSGMTAATAKSSFLPIKINSAGVIPVIFASSIMTAPSIIAGFIGADVSGANWTKIFSPSELTQMGTNFYFPWGLIIYIVLTVLFCFFYASLQIAPDQLAENFQKNGSYIPGIRPGNETEKYVKKVVNRITCIGATFLALIAALPNILTLTVFKDDASLALGGTGLIIVVGVAIELNNQINGLLAGKTFDELTLGA